MNATTTEVPPQNLDAERRLLSCCLIDPQAFLDTDGTVSPGSFYSGSHAALWELFRELEREGKPLEPTLILDAAQARGYAERIGPDLLADLVTLEFGGANAKDYANIVAEQERRRAILRHAMELQRAARDQQRPIEDVEASASMAAPAKGSRRSLIVTNVQDFLAKILPPREFVLEPILKVKDLAMLHGWRGGGKSWVSLGMACAVATGGTFLRWTAKVARRVLLVDGEMQAEDLQHRLAAILAGMGAQPEPDFLRIITPDMQVDGIPNLATPGGQAQVEKHLAPGDVLFLDNLSVLANGGPENDGESWDQMQGFLLRLRRRGITCIVVHHSGKGGKQRGTSKREDVLDLVLCLKPPADYSAREGARFQIHFEKSRGLKGEAVAAFEATPVQGLDGSMNWKNEVIEDAWRDEALVLKKEGLSLREIAEIVGKDKSTVSRALRAMSSGGGK